VLMLLVGFYTPIHAGLVLACLIAPWALDAHGGWAFAGAALLYLAPPLAARGLRAAWGWSGPEGCGARGPEAPFASPAFLQWWALGQLQLVFNRLPLLEELLRLVPGLYSGWLSLWGARVGRFVFWSPGVLVADRHLLVVGDRAVIGMGTRIASHMVVGGTGGPSVLTAPVVIEERAVVGGFSTLGPGARIAAGEMPPATLVLPPFWSWERGRRRRFPGVPAASVEDPAGADGGGR
jgi:hypothetical protein